MGQGKQETTGHDVVCDNVMWPIRVHRCASIEQVCGDFVRVEDDDWLAGHVQVDEVTWSDIQ
jgi:hypothetical protein